MSIHSIEKNKEILPDIVAQLAMNYYEIEDIAKMYNIEVEEVKRISELPAIKAKVGELRANLQKSGESFTKLARIYVEEALPYVFTLVVDSTGKPSDRLAAADFLLRSSGLASNKDNNSPVTINLNTVVQEASDRKSRVLEMRDYL